MIDKAFSVLDLSHNGLVPLEYIQSIYNAARHPDVMEGKKTEEEVLNEFLDNFQITHEFFVGKSKNLNATREEFFYFYAIISSAIDNDLAFEKMLTNTWNLRGVKAPVAEGGRQMPYLRSGTESLESPLSRRRKQELPGNKNLIYPEPRAEENFATRAIVSAQSNRDKLKDKFGNFVLPEVSKSQGLLMQRFKLKLLSRGIKGIIGLEKQFSLYDLDKTGLLDYKDFAQAIKDYNLEYDERDIPGLFRIFEKLSNGRLRIALFMEALLGKMNESRRDVVSRVFDMLDEKKAGEIDLELLLGSFCPQDHPEVKAGKLIAEEVKEEFLTSFKTFHELYYGGNSVSKQELIDYYNKFSFLMEDDSYFDVVVSDIWGLVMSLRKRRTAGTAFNVFQENSRTSWNKDFHKTLFSNEHPMRPESEFGDDIKKSSGPKEEVKSPPKSGKGDKA